MSTAIENKAKKYLFEDFSHRRFKFINSNENKFDLWRIDKQNKKKMKVELKAHSGKYNQKRQSCICEHLVFSSSDEKELFENGKTIILRVFLGDTPPTVVAVNRSLLNDGAKLVKEDRYIIKGTRNYIGSYEVLSPTHKKQRYSSQSKKNELKKGKKR